MENIGRRKELTIAKDDGYHGGNNGTSTGIFVNPYGIFSTTLLHHFSMKDPNFMFSILSII